MAWQSLPYRLKAGAGGTLAIRGMTHFQRAFHIRPPEDQQPGIGREDAGQE